jgi:hypothetical protein
VRTVSPTTSSLRHHGLLRVDLVPCVGRSPTHRSDALDSRCTGRRVGGNRPVTRAWRRSRHPSPMVNASKWLTGTSQFRDLSSGSQLMRTCYRSPPPCAVVVVTRPEAQAVRGPPARCEHYSHQAPCRLIADLYRRLLRATTF